MDYINYVFSQSVFLMLLQDEYSMIISLKHTFCTICQNVQLITNGEMDIKKAIPVSLLGFALPCERKYPRYSVSSF